jgi:hypothetical protein
MASGLANRYDRPMLRNIGIGALMAVLVWGITSRESVGQTPEQQQLWDAQRAQAQVDEKAKAERLARDRQARQADPMAWVRTLDPMTAGGWEFRAVGNDGSWAAYTTNHQFKRSGKTVTAWLREEYAEPQVSGNTHYLSVVQKVEYDCGKEQARHLLLIYYSNNNIQGSEQTEEADRKTAPWNAIVPGTREEVNFLWACNGDKSSAHN